jgi:transcriptional regulator with XRE-family HTH domain
MPRQSDLARAANMQQSRISMFETPGAANMTVETLARIAAAFRVGLIIDFVPFSRMLDWENNYSQDTFDVIKIDNDMAFLNPAAAGVMQIGGYLPLSNAMGAGCRSETIGSNAGATSNMGQRLQRATGMEHEPIQKMNGEQIDGREKRAA